MENTLDLLEALEYIDPTVLDYDQWLAVGMGLKEAGYSASVWEDWSRQDGRRFHSGECQRKWNSFNGSTAEPVTGGTVLNTYRDQAQIAAHARDSVAALVSLGVVRGSSDMRINPTRSISRAEMAVILHRVLTL